MHRTLKRLPVRLAIVGCGGMGHRHLRGLRELRDIGFSSVELIAVCDPVEENANSLADHAEETLGARPTVVTTRGDLLSHGIQAIDITSTPRTHHVIAVEALRSGINVLVEKPLGVTVAACREVCNAVASSDAVLSVAENYRRDPMCRLAKALLESGVIGAPRLIIQHGIGGGDQMSISMWRHLREHGGILLDLGVHFADVMEYLVGCIETAYAVSRLHEPVRRNPAASSGGDAIDPFSAYAQWQKKIPKEFNATVEDALYATITFSNGVIGSMIQDHAGHGAAVESQAVFGSIGSMTLPGNRSGGEIVVDLDGGRQLKGPALLDQVPEFKLEPITAALFGSDRLCSYNFSSSVIDAKLLAIEYAELVNAIHGGPPPEVNAEQGMRSVACWYALLESSFSGGPVHVQQTLDGSVLGYQRYLNESMGLKLKLTDRGRV